MQSFRCRIRVSGVGRISGVGLRARDLGADDREAVVRVGLEKEMERMRERFEGGGKREI